MQPVVDMLATLVTEMREAKLDSRSQTRAAYRINAFDLQRYIDAANIQVRGLSGDKPYNDLVTKKPEAIGFAW